MREGWEIRKLGDVCTSDLGKTLNQTKDTGCYQPYLCSINVQWDRIDLTTIKQARFEPVDAGRFSVKKGDLLVCEGGDIGRAAIWNDESPMLYQNALHRIRFNSSVSPRFCLRYLQHLKQAGILDQNYGKGVTIKHLVKSALLSIPIPVPPIQKQEKIVTELDCLSSIIEKKKKQLEELDNLTQSIFYDMFGDPYEQSQYGIKPLDTYCKIVGRIGFRGYTRNDFVETPQEGAISLSPSNIINGEMDYSKCSYITWFKYEESPEIKVYNGDILVVKTGSSYGKVALVKDLPHKASINPQFVVLKDVQCNRYFLEYYLKTPFARDKYEEFVIGTAIPTFSQKKLGTLPIVDVPIDLQTTFAHNIEAIEHQKSLIKQSIQETETLFNSRMDYWFN